MRINQKMFLFYWTILFLLLTVTITVLELKRKIPDMIAQPVSAMQADRIILSVADAEKLKEVLRDYSYHICDCTPQSVFTEENLSVFQESSEKMSFEGAILLNHSHPDSYQLSDLNKNMVDGAMCSNQSNGLWISEAVQEQSGLCCGDTVAFCLPDGTATCNLSVFGVFSDGFENSHSYYVSEDVYTAYRSSKQNETLMITLIPNPFRAIFQMISMLRKQNINFIYSEQTVNALSMVYILFAAIVIVLLITLFSILIHLLQFYYNKRRRFFAVNAAIGMDSSSAAKIMVLTAECIVLSALAAAFITAMLAVNAISHYTGGLFEVTAEHSFFSLQTILITVITVQADVMLVLFLFFKHNNTNNIITMIREN